jgi:hypothetical protein
VFVPGTEEPGQTFDPSELPNVKSLKDAGINPAQFLSGLPVRGQTDFVDPGAAAHG